MSEQKALSVIVVGGGIGGLSAAVALRQAGHNVKVLERSSLSSEAGLAITLYPNAIRILRRWGMDLEKARMVHNRAIEILQADVTPMRTVFYSDQSAYERRFQAPCLLSHRADLHEALRGLAAGEDGAGASAELVTDAAVVSYDPQKGIVALEDGSTMAADVVVAADGLHSRAHEYILGEERAAKPSGTTVIRFMISTKEILANSKTASLMVGGAGQVKIYKSQDDKRSLVRYPCRDNELQNFGAYSSHENQEDEGGHSQSNREALLRRVKGFDPAILEVCQMAEEILPLWKCCDRDPLPRFQSGRLVLLGDACHPMLPHLGQGGCQAIEDAAVLGVLFKGVTSGEKVSKRLEIFEQLRRNRISAIQVLARLPPSIINTPDDVAERVKQFFPPGQVPKDKTATMVFIWSLDCMAEAESHLQEQA